MFSLSKIITTHEELKLQSSAYEEIVIVREHHIQLYLERCHFFYLPFQKIHAPIMHSFVLMCK